ncbi:MAG: 50S ribosomal protein L25 [Planctomycetota bacterium]
MSDSLAVELRPKLGKRNNRALRAAGQLPAVLYGHGEDPVTLAICRDAVRGVLRHGGHVVELTGAASGKALVQDTQYDAFGSRLLHIDLLRVDAKEMVQVEVAVELKGDAVGANEGGMIEQPLHMVEVEASAVALPEKIVVDVSELHLNESITAGDVKDLPAGVKLVTAADEVIVQCVPPAGEPTQDGVAAAAGEPEVIGDKAAGDGESES